MKELYKKIEAIPERNFYGCGSVDAELEAYGEETYIICLPIEVMRDEYGPYNCENTREEDYWIEDKAWIREYFLDHISDIEIYGDD